MYCFFGDLSGFQKIILNLSLPEQEIRITQWITLVESTSQLCQIEKVKLISDSIVAITDETPEGLEKLTRFSRILLTEGLKLSLPLRGAISQGEVQWSEKIVFGRAVIDAYQLAANQNWWGVTFTFNFPIPPSMWGINTVVTYPTPLKKGRIGTFSVIAWEIPPVINLLKLTSDKGLTKEGEHLEWDYFDKMNNTIIFSLYLKTLKKVERESQTKVNASHFQGTNPLEIIEHVIDGHPMKIG